MAITKPLKEALMKSLAGELAQYGFKFIRKRQLYYRKTPYGKDMLLILFTHPGYGFDAALHTYVRHDAVEDLLLIAPHEWPPEKDEPWTTTIGNDMAYTTGAIHLKWSVVQEVDIVNAILGMMETIRSKAFPYFERFSSLEEVLSMFLRRDIEAKRIRGSFCYPWWASRVIALAYLLKRRDVFEGIVQEVNTQLEQGTAVGMHDDYVRQYSEYQEFAAELRRRWDMKEEQGNL